MKFYKLEATDGFSIKLKSVGKEAIRKSQKSVEFQQNSVVHHSMMNRTERVFTIFFFKSTHFSV